MKTMLLSCGLALATMAGSTNAQAQAKPADGFISMIGDVRVLVNSPSSVPTPSAITLAATGTTPWGGNVSTPILNMPVIRAFGSSGTDSLMCTAAPSATTYSNKIAILFRGACGTNPNDPNSEFGSKALKAQQGGAIAVIIVNNIPGAPLGMLPGSNGAQVTVPVFMVSDVDGAAIVNALNNGIAVNMSFGRWGLGSPNDIGIMPKSSASTHAGAIPLSQLPASNGNPVAYRMFNGAMAVNFGTTTQTNIKNATTVAFTPDGGSAVQVHTDTAVLTSLSPSDSLNLVFNTNIYNPHASSKGAFTITSSIVPSSADAIPTDNSQTRMMYVTDSIYCKGTWNNTTMRPVVPLARRATTDNIWSWGPLLYTAVGGAYLDQLQFTLANGTANVSTLDGLLATICAFKWTDGAGGNPENGVIEAGELSLKAIGAKAFGATDSNFSNIYVPFDPRYQGNVVKPLESNSWYYYTVTPNVATTFIGVDNNSNDYMRMFVSNRVNPLSREYLSPQYMGEAQAIPSGGIGDFRMVPYFFDAEVDIDSVSVDLTGRSVNAALHTRAKSLISVGNIASLTIEFSVSPNPSNGIVSLKYAFLKDMGKAMVSVINGLGQSIATKTVTDSKGIVSFDLSNFAAGNYWIIYGSAAGTESTQFQIIK